MAALTPELWAALRMLFTEVADDAGDPTTLYAGSIDECIEAIGIVIAAGVTLTPADAPSDRFDDGYVKGAEDTARIAALRDAPSDLRAAAQAYLDEHPCGRDPLAPSDCDEEQALRAALSGDRPSPDHLTAREQSRLVCGTCGCPFVDHNEFGCKPHGMHEFRRAYLASPATAPAEHPGEPHDFNMDCRKCGQPGRLFVAFTAPDEDVRIEPVARPAPDSAQEAE